MADDTERRTMRVKVYERESYGDGEQMPDNLVEAIVWLQSKLDLVPDQYRSTAEIEISAADYSLEMEINYKRPETDAEITERLERARLSREYETRRELEQLRRLQTKYYGTP